jgi:hypothetical protein
MKWCTSPWHAIRCTVHRQSDFPEEHVALDQVFCAWIGVAAAPLQDRAVVRRCTTDQTCADPISSGNYQFRYHVLSTWESPSIVSLSILGR